MNEKIRKESLLKVKQNGFNLRFLKYQTEEICLAAVRNE